MQKLLNAEKKYAKRRMEQGKKNNPETKLETFHYETLYPKPDFSKDGDN